MAQNLTHTEVRNFQLSNGTTADLIALISNNLPSTWVRATGAPEIGTVAYVYAMGDWRRGVVVKTTPTKTFVALTTAAAAAPGGTSVRVQTTADTHERVMVAPAPVVETPAEPVQEAEEAPVVAQPTASRELAAQLVGRVLRTEPVLDLLPPLAHGRELVRLADLSNLVPASLLTLHSQAGKVDTMNNASETQTETAPAQKHTGSTVVALIEKVWDRIRADHPELPEVVVTTGSGEGLKWGHFRPESWKLAEAEGRMHEFFLASEALAKGATQVLQTTIHEAAHTLSKVRGVKDTSRQGRWHNAAFKKAAEELGLEHKAASADKSLGFSFVTLTEATKGKYADLLAELDSELKLTGLLPFWLGGTDGEDERGGEKITGKPKSTGGEEGEGGGTKSGNLKATCQCPEPVIIRLSRKVLDLGVVRCDGCSELFTAA
jgi:hypothetical protein